MECFWDTMQVELLNRRRRTTVIGLSLSIADYIENVYNVERRHSSLEYFTRSASEEL
jgi:transposase InsO family protein